MGGVAGNERVDLFLALLSHAKKIFSEPANFKLDRIAGLPEGFAHLIAGLVTNIGLKQHLHSEFADLRRWRLVKRTALLDLAAQAHHFNRGHGGLKALLPALMPARFSACSRVSQVSTPKLWEYGLLLRLADAAGHFVVDSFMWAVSTAQQATQRHDGVHSAHAGRGASRGGNLPRAGNANDWISLRSAPLRRRASSAPSSNRSVTTAFQRETMMANFIPEAERSPSRQRACLLPGPPTPRN